ncbi:MAG: hypothetical protein EXS12_04720 [Phycisphaerales bacterium]|nr:hypothetical protein [Phycisphaerales bacterium]
MQPPQWISFARNAIVAGLAAVVLGCFLGGWICGFALLSVWILSGWQCAAWLLSAFGLGVFAKEKVFGRGPDGCALAFAFGIAMQLIIDQWLGSLGLFSALRGAVALGVFVPGWIMTLRFVVRAWKLQTQDKASSLWWWPALPAIAALLIAASISPGVVWSTEFCGYDALEYHLQAPKEWMAAGAIRPLEFLAYSGMPNFVEGGFLHVMSLSSDARDGAVACQLLHASMLLVAAFVLADAAALLASGLGINSHIARLCALCATLATPWLIVAGSLAYSESGIVLAFACVLNVFARQGISFQWGGFILGALIAVLIGSKASSLILVVPAIVAWFALRVDCAWKNWKSIACGAFALAIGLTPWLARNWYYTGTPFFPLVTNLMGVGWWSGEQGMRWNQAHASDATMMQRGLALWNQLFVFGLGENPTAGNPWKWFWGPLPWIGVGSVALLSMLRTTRHVAAALALSSALIVIGWMFATHLQSRFLIPLAIPLSLAFGLAAASVFGGALSVNASAVGAPKRNPLSLLLCAWAVLPAWNLATDTPQAAYFIGENGYLQGNDDWCDLRCSDASLRAAAAKNATAELVINHWRPEWRVLSVGWSTPFWIHPNAPLTWSSVWDTNAIESCHGLSTTETAALLSQNFDAILIDVPMLERWQRSGWLSPKINLDQLKELSKSLPHLAQLRGGKILLGLRGNVVLNLPAIE